ncbi:hypothetical protein HUU53_00440 [Candidatus Micrarchaeota archaeon]|nr:hypothetical protein [Candidatus Micrarchaeota archaeon]
MIAGIGKSLKSLPRIISVSRRETSLMDYKRPDWIDGRSMSEFSSLMTDYEIKLLVVWALISPLAALAFVIWTKYDKLKWIALPLFVVSIFQFIGHWGGFFWVFERFFNP